VGERYFEEIDRLLGRYRAWAERNRATLALVSDHGFLWSDGRPERLSSVDNTTARAPEGGIGSCRLRRPEIAPGRDATPAPLRHASPRPSPRSRFRRGGSRQAAARRVRATSEPSTIARSSTPRATAAAPLTGAGTAETRRPRYLGGASSAPAPAAAPDAAGGSFNNEGLI
jgi:hypothetical protein